MDFAGKLDPDTIKTILTALSTVISVVSLALALKTRAQSKQDHFNQQRALLKLQMAQHDRQAEYLNVQASVLMSRINNSLERHPERKNEETAKMLESLSTLANLWQPNSVYGNIIHCTRAAALEWVEKLKRTKDNEERLRNVLTIEQKQETELRSETWSVVFKEANLLIDDLRALDSPRVGQEKAK